MSYFSPGLDSGLNRRGSKDEVETRRVTSKPAKTKPTSFVLTWNSTNHHLFLQNGKSHI